jgi:hypothetical protein
MVAKVATPWGGVLVVDEIELPQGTGERPFASLVQLLEADGEQLVRFAYTTDGRARRGPVTLRAVDVERLRKALVAHPKLAAAIATGPAATRSLRRAREPTRRASRG